MLNIKLKSVKKFFRSTKVSAFILACFLLLGLWQSTRSSWHATLVHMTRLFNQNVLHTGKISGSATVKLNVGIHRQEHSLSCEIAALKIALSAYGIHVSESELISKLVFDPTPRTNMIWGDPHQGFVGDIDGRMGVTGYGVYWEPIAKVGSSYLRSEIFKASPALVAEHLLSGRPVVMWGYFGAGNKISWTTPQNKQIVGVNGEHARTVTGFIGSTSNPEGFIVIDPIYGEQYWTTSSLFSNWSAFDSMGVVIYPHPKWVKVAGNPTIWEISSDGSIKYPLAMDWERFLEYGGVPAGVKTISTEQLANISNGFTIH